jgi:hypothetical protein
VSIARIGIRARFNQCFRRGRVVLSDRLMQSGNLRQQEQKGEHGSLVVSLVPGEPERTRVSIGAMRTYERRRKLIPCALIFFISSTLSAQDARRDLARDLVKHWQILKSLSLEVAHAIPAGAYTPKAALAESDPNKIGPFEMGSVAVENVLSCSLALSRPAPARFHSRTLLIAWEKLRCTCV